MKKFRISVFIFALILLSALKVSGIGLKIIRQYPDALMSEALAWQIENKEDWIFAATDDGLIQYNGGKPLLFPMNNRRAVRSVTLDNENSRLYVGGISEFGYFKPSPFSSLDYICLSDSIGEDRHIGNIWGIYPHENTLIAQGDEALLIYDITTGKHSVIGSDHKLDMSAFLDGVLWLGTNDGLKLLLGNTIVDAPGAEQLKGKRIRKILPYGEGYLIITSDGVWQYKYSELQPLKEFGNKIRDLGEIFSADIHNNILALGTVDHGLALLNLSDGDFSIYDESSGLPSNTVLSIKFDDNGNLWSGMQFGLIKVLRDLPIENLGNSKLPIGSGYVMALKDNDLFLGTNRGLYKVKYDPETDRLDEKLEFYDNLRGQVWGLTLLEDKIFVGHDRGLFEISPNNSIRQIGNVSGVWDVRGVLGSKNKAYIGTYTGLHLMKNHNGRWEYEGPVPGYNTSMYDFYQEKPDVIWNNNADIGIDRLEIDTINWNIRDIKTFIETSDKFPLTSDTHLSRIDNKIYFSTTNGIYVYDPIKEEIVKEKENSQLLGNPGNVKRLNKSNGSLIALTDKEVLLADPAGILDLKRIPLDPSIARPMHDRDLFFPVGSDYLGYPVRSGFLFFESSLSSPYNIPKENNQVKIHSVRLTEESDSVIFRGNFNAIKNIPELSHHQNSLRIEYGSKEDLDLGILYSTRINKEPWSQAAPILEKELTDLKPGAYKFEVKAIAPDGKSVTESFNFKISPPWWQAKWIFFLYALMGLCLVIFLVRWEQLRFIKKEKQLLNEKNREIASQAALHQLETEEKDRHIRELEKERLEKDLRHKAQEVSNVMMSLSHKNETLQLVKRELQNVLSLLPRGNTDARKVINSLKDKVDIDIESDDVLKRVEEEFDIVHDNFIKKLKSKYTDLNNNEILLCAYIKMNLSTKEIAPLLNISQRGVETMRYRLRKKLNLEREDSLSNFISNFKG